MSYNVEKYIKILELDKVLESVAEHAVTQKAKNDIMGIVPARSFDEASKLIEKTFCAYNLTALNSAPPFSDCSGINNVLERAKIGAVLSARELLNTAKCLKTVRNVKAWYTNSEGIQGEKSLDFLFERLTPNKFLEEKIFFIIRSEDEINDNASELLSSIRRKKASYSSKIRENLDRIVRGTASKYLQEAIITQRDGRYVVPVKTEFRAEIKGIVHDMSSSGSTVFIEPVSVVEINNEIRILEARESEEIERILFELSSRVLEYSEDIYNSYEALTELDAVFAKSKYAYSSNSVKPILNSDGKIVLNGARHPLIDKKSVVPINISLGEKFDTLVITGPNTGGKTVALKTLGLFTMMAACGLMIPASDGSEIAVFDMIFADIGDEQSISQSLSTFSSHLVNIISILENCNENSLVLFDELCAGTDPVEGAALAKAILIRLLKIKAKTAATTHYPELKSYALDTNGVQNAGCEFDINTLRPTYRLIIGSPGRSNAFLISKRLGLSEDVIKTAESQVDENSERLERVIAALEKERQKAQSLYDKNQNLKRDLEKEKAQIDLKLKELEKQSEQIKEKAEIKAADIIESARNKSSELLNRLEQMKKDMTPSNSKALLENARTAYRASEKEFDDISNPVKELNIKGEKLKSAPKAGDTVIISSLDSEATVLEVDEKGKRAFVLSGFLKTWVKFDGLLYKKGSPEKKSKPKKSSVTGLSSKADRIVPSSIDLRGMTGDEAILELEKYIDNAVLAGLGEVTVIHGKGTGALRKAVQSYLKSNKHVKSFRLGVFGEGENGVSIVTLD